MRHVDEKFIHTWFYPRQLPVLRSLNGEDIVDFSDFLSNWSTSSCPTTIWARDSSHQNPMADQNESVSAKRKKKGQNSYVDVYPFRAGCTVRLTIRHVSPSYSDFGYFRHLRKTDLSGMLPNIRWPVLTNSCQVLLCIMNVAFLFYCGMFASARRALSKCWTFTSRMNPRKCDEEWHGHATDVAEQTLHSRQYSRMKQIKTNLEAQKQLSSHQTSCLEVPPRCGRWSLDCINADFSKRSTHLSSNLAQNFSWDFQFSCPTTSKDQGSACSPSLSLSQIWQLRFGVYVKAIKPKKWERWKEVTVV